MGAYLIYRMGECLVRILPRNLIYRLSDLLSDLFYFFRRGVRRAVRANLRHVLGAETDDRELERRVRLVFRYFGRAIADFLAFNRLRAEDLDEILQIDNLSQVTSLAERGKGVVIVTGHFGNWELGGAVFALRGFPLTVPALDHPSVHVTRYFTAQREKQGIRVASLGAARGALADALARGEYVGVLGDLFVGRKGETVELCGRGVRVPTGYLEVAVEQEAFVVPAFVIRTEGRKHRAFFEPPLESRGETAEEKVKDLAQGWARVMEKYITRYPEQWILFHSVWRD